MEGLGDFAGNEPLSLPSPRLAGRGWDGGNVLAHELLGTKVAWEEWDAWELCGGGQKHAVAEIAKPLRAETLLREAREQGT